MLGAIREDLVSVLSIAFGGDVKKAEAKVAELELMIQQRAAQGTAAAVQQQIPGIRAQVDQQVKKTVQPVFLAAVAVGGLGVLLGVVALIKNR